MATSNPIDPSPSISITNLFLSALPQSKSNLEGINFSLIPISCKNKLYLSIRIVLFNLS